MDDNRSDPGRECAHERDLVRRIQQGDSTAFQPLVERFQAKVHSAAYAILKNRQDAEDISQEVFAKVYVAIGNFRLESSLYSWIYRITVNECYGLLRRRGIKTLPENGGTRQVSTVTAVDRGPSVAETAEQRDFLNKLLARIPQQDRLLVIGKDVEGMSISELARMSGLGEGQLKLKLFRIRKHLARSARWSWPPPALADKLAPLQFAPSESD